MHSASILASTSGENMHGHPQNPKYPNSIQQSSSKSSRDKVCAKEGGPKGSEWLMTSIYRTIVMS